MGRDGIISATLADIYLDQGYPEKALEIYTKLLEREPDNRTYKERASSLKRHLEEKKLSPFRRALRRKLW